MEPLKVIIAHVHDELFHGDALSITVPGSEGEFTVLAHHTPLITKIKKGIITVRTLEAPREFPVEDGLFEMSQNTATILL